MRMIISLLGSFCLVYLSSCKPSKQITFLDIEDNSLIQPVLIQNSDAKSLKQYQVFGSKFKEYHRFKFTAEGYYNQCSKKSEILKRDTIYLIKVNQWNKHYQPLQPQSPPPPPPPPECSFNSMKFDERVDKLRIDRGRNVMKFINCAKSKCEIKTDELIFLGIEIDSSGVILSIKKVRGDLEKEDWEILSSKLDKCKFNLGEILIKPSPRQRPSKDRITFIICND